MTPTIAAQPAAGYLNLFPEFAGTRRFTSAEYHQLIDSNILGPDDHVELLDGYVRLKMDYVDPPPDGPFPEWRWLRRWSLGEYHRMIDLGIIDREEKLELLDGYVVLKMPQNPPHRNATMRLLDCLLAHLPKGWVRLANSTVETGLFEPEPDVVVVRGVMADYEARNPVPADFGIVIEVSDSTLEGDRKRKSRLFAKLGLPVYWIVNLADRVIEVYTDPDATANPPAYRTRTDYAPGDSVPITLDGAAAGAIPVSELMP